jgi:hypothetical protein
MERRRSIVALRKEDAIKHDAGNHRSGVWIMNISLDLDDGVKVNYAKLGDVLAKI